MTEAGKLAAILVADMGHSRLARMDKDRTLARLVIGVIVRWRDQPAAAFESGAAGLFAVLVVSLTMTFFQMVSLGTIFWSPSSEWI